jgi:hypothetical protein
MLLPTMVTSKPSARVKRSSACRPQGYAGQAEHATPSCLDLFTVVPFSMAKIPLTGPLFYDHTQAILFSNLGLSQAFTRDIPIYAVNSLKHINRNRI